MRKFTFHQVSPGTLVTAGMRRVQFPRSKYKQFGYGAAIVLAVLGAPFAVQAMSGNLVSKDAPPQGETTSGQHVSQPGSEAKSNASEGAKSMDSDIKVESKIESSGAERSDVDVTVNGQNVPVPENGTVHKRLSGNNGETTVDVRVDNGSSSQSSSSSTVIIEQHSYSSGDTTNEGGTGRHPARR